MHLFMLTFRLADWQSQPNQLPPQPLSGHFKFCSKVGIPLALF